MKKIILFALTLIIAFSFISCSTSYGKHFIANTYPKAPFSLIPYNPEGGTFDSVSEVTDEETLKLFYESFTAVTEYFNITIEQPAIKWYDDVDQTQVAVYNWFDSTIYINRSSVVQNLKTTLVHEILHYISHNGIVSGIAYHLNVQGDTAVMGLKLNEGLTEYFAQEIAPFNYLNNNLDIYYFGSYIAKSLSAIVGKEKLKEIYITNSHEELRDLFNKHLDMSFGLQSLNLDSFDFFCMQVDAYLSEVDEFEKGLRMNSIVDELLIIAKGERKEKEVKNIIAEFNKNFQEYLPSTYAY